MKSLKAKNIKIDAPNLVGTFKALIIPFAFFYGRMVTLTFTCANCGFINQCQYDENKGYVKCKNCKSLNNIES